MEENIPQKMHSHPKSNKWALYIFIFIISVFFTSIGSAVYYLNFTSLRGNCGFDSEYSWWKPEWRFRSQTRTSEPKKLNPEQKKCIHQATAIVKNFCTKEEVRDYYTKNLEPLVKARRHQFSLYLDRFVEDIMDEGEHSQLTNVRDRRDFLLRIMRYQCTTPPASSLIVRSEVSSTTQTIIDSMCGLSTTSHECQQIAKEVWLEGENIFAAIYDGCSRLSGDQKSEQIACFKNATARLLLDEREKRHAKQILSECTHEESGVHCWTRFYHLLSGTDH